MSQRQPFTAVDLDDLDERLLARAVAVVPMREARQNGRDVIGMRHDIDANLGAFETAVALAEWEAERGYRSTYFILHTAPYWRSSGFATALDRIAGLGHEIGLHTNAVAEALRTGGDPDAILETALARLRGLGHTVTGTVGHGDRICAAAQFVNDEHFEEGRRPPYGPPNRPLAHGQVTLRLRPRPLADFGLHYLANWLPRALCLTDSGGAWNADLAAVAAGFPYAKGQTHVLQHPDWWTEAL